MTTIIDGLRLFGNGNPNRLPGTELNDLLEGGGGNDTLPGRGGHDAINGGDGDDMIRGGDGNDTILGGGGADQLRGGAGDDSVSGGDGADNIATGAGNDIVEAGRGADTIATGGGEDLIRVVDNLLDRLDPNPGVREVIGAEEDHITDFNARKDSFALDGEAFGLTGDLIFFSGVAAELPVGGANVIVLRDTDNDANPATAFNAGAAASLIAAAVETEGAGFFIYSNSALGVNRLVYSDDLSDPTADLQIIARFTDATGQAAIDALADFSAENFTLIG